MQETYGINYSKPEVVLMQDTGIGVAEAAARTCYDSFQNSENESVKYIQNYMPDDSTCKEINDIQESSLLDDLAWTHFHHSILEHANLSFLIRGTSRGVLQEHARHRIQAISVRSTRYTMSSVINAFVASHLSKNREFFIDKILDFDMFVTCDKEYNKIEAATIYDKLEFQFKRVEDFYEIAVAKSSLGFLEEFKNSSEVLFEALESGKKKRNVGDAFKHIVTDNWKVDMVVTFNLRSLKNYFTLRDSGAAYFQIRWLAQEMMRATPSKYLDLIIKKK
ncbi:MAG: thymidylate synthase [Sulfurimonas sp. RIFOXYD12_FULL_33_39]|uniref:FAD-dependent thymidylate synthase n=1 Tax=unclassified Sulfurimonas TaxID=2623549 RepID=UPI0008B4A1B5|nr:MULTISPECIES: FAD-dependent thymidylate synthase [unclassified Sulfurimonas]OHE05106.1 MAG: thymidylate synthase [Sulfurimonas sp. RIFCSPLOWO2_12_FULL_34_6]OHE10922.1 MAG: thymidylate synthase [Sulfurimonas sp. RIFOXYD12_FULL_33_39]OHE13308.1 MAG: thymidylate synthase [Sulfurimonas sp. RIFOXYD2_FULL_34_21]